MPTSYKEQKTKKKTNNEKKDDEDPQTKLLKYIYIYNYIYSVLILHVFCVCFFCQKNALKIVCVDYLLNSFPFD